MASLIQKFLSWLHYEEKEQDKYRIIERGDGSFSAQESYWNGWRDIKDSQYQSVCYEEIEKRRKEDVEIARFTTIKRVIKV